MGLGCVPQCFYLCVNFVLGRQCFDITGNTPMLDVVGQNDPTGRSKAGAKQIHKGVEKNLLVNNFRTADQIICGFEIRMQPIELANGNGM